MKRWLVAATVVLATACGPGAPDAASTAGEAATGTAQALDFSAPLVGGGQLEGGDLAGRDVVLWFWAPW